MSTVISVENLSKQYRLGNIGSGELIIDFQRWWARMRGRPDPWSTIGEDDHNNRDGEYIWALQDVSFRVQQGEALGIIGRNGAGKSTLLKILSRVTAPTSGKIKVKGRIASLLEVGTGFHPDLTGRENVYLNGAILGMTQSEIDSKFAEIVNFAEIEKFIDTPVKRYSSGMYVRLAFAVAAHLEPEILVVDEVLAVGDIEFQRKCLGKMSDVAKEGRTVLFVSHNMVAVNKLCQSCLWIDKGVIKERGETSDVVDLYTRTTIDRAAEGSFVGTSISGDGRVQLLSYRITNALGESVDLPKTNEDMYVEIKLLVRERISQPACGISITNDHGVLMTSINTVEQGISLSAFPAGNLTLEIKLNQISFLPGNYVASIWIMSPQGHIYALADNAIRFEIGQSQIYGTQQIDHRWGVVFTKVEFLINDCTTNLE
jgi:lipopolysaccharide transport system ATP-binding protein